MLYLKSIHNRERCGLGMSKQKILLLYDNTELDRQVLKPADYLSFESEWIRQGGGNSGNKLFLSATEQYLHKEDIEYEYYMGEEREEIINEKYDLIVIPMANMFNANPGVINQLNEYTNLIEKFKIPVYVLGCGVQCNSYDDIDQLALLIKEPVERFLRAIYQTGGELALRGYATKEFLDKVMPNTAVVTGCPSFYQRGSGLRISNDKVPEEQFKPSINGNLRYLKQIDMLQVFEQYPNSVYLDQDELAQVLYFRGQGRYNNTMELVRKKTLYSVRLLAEDRVKLFYDVPVWLSWFEEENISFSCGSRIHGNIAATLAGVPAMVMYRDARTRELAEFFELPNSAAYDTNKSLYEIYLDANYTNFNRHFADKFRTFEHFVVSHGISHDLEDRSLFEKRLAAYSWKYPELPGQKNIDRIRKSYNKHKTFYQTYEGVLGGMRKAVKAK